MVIIKKTRRPRDTSLCRIVDMFSVGVLVSVTFSVRLLEAKEARLCPGCSLSLVKLTDIIDILRSGFFSPTFELCT